MARPLIPTPIGPWTARKVEYLDYYLQAYRRVTQNRPAYYIDAFSGCGDCVLRPGGYPVEGSAWRALRAQPNFTRYFLVEKEPILASHLESRIRAAGITHAMVLNGDCNEILPSKVLPMVPKDAASFAFLDPSGLQLAWTTIETLAQHRRGPWKMELLVLFPYDMVAKRWFSLEELSDTYDRFFGTNEWQRELSESEKAGEEPLQKRQRFLRLYTSRLRGLGYRHVEAYGPLTHRRRPLYHFIFAGDNDTGHRIMNDVWARPRAIPGELDYVPLRRPML